ncbi:MAG: hypothetical protein V2A56_08855 [bacterium]
MTYPHRLEAKGIWYTKAIIAALVIILVTSVLYPGHLWKRHEALIQSSRDDMENLNYIEQRYFQVTSQYSENLDTLITFMQTDSIDVQRGQFEFEQLSLYDAPYDSFLVGFTDLYHYDRIEVDGYKNGNPVTADEEADSVILKLMPKKIYDGIIEPSKMAMTSPRGVDHKFRNEGVDDIYWTIWSAGKLARPDLPFEVKRVPSKDYLLFLPLDKLGIDPISGKSFELIRNAKITLEATLTYTKVGDGQPEPSVMGDELRTNLFMNRLARKARTRLEQDIQRDSTLAESQLQLQDDYFDMELTLLRPGREVAVEASKELMVPLDSITNYNDDVRIQVELFKLTYDSLIRAWTKWDKTQQTLGQLTYSQDFKIGNQKIVGVTIQPPFKNGHPLRHRNLLDRLFSVGPVKYPGDIVNNDLSWDEKR